jgi:FkbM family methyltransferase
MSRIFLDVGSNVGQTIELLSQPRFRVDHIIGFEPSPICCNTLGRKFKDNSKITIIQAGLWSETCEMKLHNEGSVGGTVYVDYQTTCNPELRVTKCKFIKASDWFKDNISSNDEVFLKINAEGSECEIVSDLLNSGEYYKIKALLIDFDIRKSPSNKHKENELREQMKMMNINNVHIYAGDYRHMLLPSILR